MSKITELTLAAILGVDDRFLITKDVAGTKSDNQISPAIIRQFMIMTGAEIKAAYENEANTNAYTDTEKSKLAGVEENATADQTGSEIKTAYENEADTNAYTDTEKSKLAGIEENAKVNVKSDWNSNSGDSEIENKPSDVTDLAQHSIEELNDITNKGSGSIISVAERAKLNTVEVNAAADQTGAEIKTAYEGEANTNAFTDAEKLDLAGSKNYAKKMAIIFG